MRKKPRRGKRGRVCVVLGGQRRVTEPRAAGWVLRGGGQRGKTRKLESQRPGRNGVGSGEGERLAERVWRRRQTARERERVREISGRKEVRRAQEQREEEHTTKCS